MHFGNRPLRRKIAAVTAAGVSSVALAAIPTTAAHAASGCWDAGFTRTNPYGYTTEAFYCHNVSPTPVYGAATYESGQVGTMRSSTSWFLCTFDNGEDNGSSAHPFRWVYTESDDGTWGYIPDKKIYSETDTIRNPCFL